MVRMVPRGAAQAPAVRKGKRAVADDLTRPPKPDLPTWLTAYSEWRGIANKSGTAFELLLRPYQQIGKKKHRQPAEYVGYLSTQQWERIKQYDRNKQRQLIDARFAAFLRSRQVRKATG